MLKKILFAVFLIILVIWRYELIYSLQLKRLSIFSDKERDKIWVHRVNSLERLSWVKDDFKGVEFDVVFNTQKKGFVVCHPPEDSLGPSLSSYVRVLSSSKLMGWVDVKVLKKEDVDHALSELHALSTIFPIRERLIFELYDPAIVPAFEKAGFRVMQNISTVVQAFPFISGESIWYKEMKDRYPSSRLFIWDLSWKNFLNRESLKYSTEDEQVEVVLVNIKSPGYE